MKNVSEAKNNMDDYWKLESKIDFMCEEKDLIEAHKKLMGKVCENSYYEIKDCGIEFIRKFLLRDWGRSIVYHYSEGASRFIKSKYLSDYVKNGIKEMLLDDSLNSRVLRILDGNKMINQMNEEEIRDIYFSLRKYCLKSGNMDVRLLNDFMAYLYKLDGNGVVSFIKNNVSNRELASQILLTSGLVDCASYYAGRGVNLGDLNEENLVAIFKKLWVIDRYYAVNFKKMVSEMKTLGATEFINSFNNLAINDFRYKGLEGYDNNFSLDGVYGNARGMVGLVVIASARNEVDKNYQILVTERIKTMFLLEVMPILSNDNLVEEERSSQVVDSFGRKRKK